MRKFSGKETTGLDWQNEQFMKKASFFREWPWRKDAFACAFALAAVKLKPQRGF